VLSYTDEQTIDQVWMPPTLPVYTDEQTIDQVWMPPTLPVHTDEQTVSSLRANFAWDKRVFIGFQRQRAAGLRLARAPAAAGRRRLALGLGALRRVRPLLAAARSVPIGSAHNTKDQKAAMVNGVVRDFRTCVIGHIKQCRSSEQPLAPRTAALSTQN
jgi:hypothetical protein